jgi:hypothetical protein
MLKEVPYHEDMSYHKNIWCHNPEDIDLKLHLCESLEIHIKVYILPN